MSRGMPPEGARGWDEQDKIATQIEFHQLYYDNAPNTWYTTTWRGVNIHKNPCDLWIYQELIFKLKPDLIIETGTLHGGSALYMVDLCNLIGNGHILTIDINSDKFPYHPRITYMMGASSIADETLRVVNVVYEDIVKDNTSPTVMVILDSDHEMNHVLKEMELYSPFVTPGSYLIVEDTNLNGHPIWPTFGPGPKEAVDAFLANHPEFEQDRYCERLMLTFNGGGYLRRKE